MNEIEAGSMYERSINIHAIQKMEVTVKILRIVLYIAAFVSFHSLSHAVNIRYCIKNASDYSILISIEHTLNTFTVKKLI